MRRVSAFLLIALTVAFLPRGAEAHETRPAFLQMTELSSGRFDVVWKRPARGDRVLSLSPKLTPDCMAITPPVELLAGGSSVRRWTVACGDDGLKARVLTIGGLERTLTDVLVRIAYAKGGTESVILRPADPSHRIKGPAGWFDLARDYTILGVEHILGGIDHLLFVLCLLLLVHGVRPLIKTVTAFTIAHSITLGAAVLGYVTVPPGPVEALIALSIVFLATEIIKERSGLAPSLTRRMPWLIAFIFGLLHGFGFAGALSQVGLPQTDIPLALLAFNVGVEVGQLLFIAAALAALWVWRRLDIRAPRLAAASHIPAYLIGAVAAYWVVERATGLVS